MASQCWAAKGLGVTNFQDVQAFVRCVREAPSLTDIGLVLKDATRSFQFDHFALAQRINTPSRIGAVRLTDFPDAWTESLVPSGRVADDPVLLACERSMTPFAWSNLESILPMTVRHRTYMSNARDAGLVDGYTVPIHVPGQASGLVSFVMAQGRPLPAESLPAAQYLACFAFEAARRLKLAARGDDPPESPKLTQRQVDCLVLAARGKSNWVTAQLLGLSEGTVHKYLEAAKHRYGVSSRTELVVRALFDGQLAFADVMGDRQQDG